MTSMTNALQQTTNYTYTTEGELNSLGQPQPGGLLKTITDPSQRITRYAYDSLGQKIAVTDPLNRTTHYTYDSLGRLIDTTDPQGRVTYNVYNAAGRLLRTTRNYDPARPQNDQNLYNIVTEYEYDAEGHQILVRDTLGHETEYHYDQKGRLETTINALDQTVSTNIFDETGALVETIDAASNHTTYVKDAAGRPVSTLDPFGHGSVNTYDIAQNATTVTDALDHATVTYFDRNNRPVRVVNDLQGETLTTYDGNGNTITKTDPLGHVTYYEYDELNRVKRQVQNYDPARPQNDQNLYNIVTTYTYNMAGNQTQVTDTLGRVTYSEYDTHGRLSRQTRNYDPSRPQNDQGQYNVVTEYGYDENGIQNRVTDTFGHVTLSEFDLLGRLSRQTQNYDSNRPQNDQNQYNLITEYRYVFQEEERLPAGSRMRVYAGNLLDAPPEEPNTNYRFVASLEESGQARFPAAGVYLRLVDSNNQAGHTRRILPESLYTEVGSVRVLRKSDGTGLFLLIPDGTGSLISEAQYRLRLTYRRDNTAVDPNSLVYREAGISDDEQVFLDIPWGAVNK